MVHATTNQKHVGVVDYEIRNMIMSTSHCIIVTKILERLENVLLVCEEDVFFEISYQKSPGSTIELNNGLTYSHDL
jgi:hypothetical protein